MRYNHSDIQKRRVKKMTAAGMIKKIESSSTFVGEDLSLKTCLEEGYLFQYNEIIFQVLKQDTSYILLWTTTDINYDNWMYAALENEGITVEQFERLEPLEKASLITGYFGFIELSGGYYDKYPSLKKTLEKII